MLRPAPHKEAAAASQRPATRVTLKLVHVDFWSVTKFWFFWSVLGGAAIILLTLLVWSVLDQSGALASIDTLMNGIVGNAAIKINDVASLGQVLGFMTVVSALNVIVITALSALSALLYNLTVAISGGLTLGLSPEGKQRNLVATTGVAGRKPQSATPTAHSFGEKDQQRRAAAPAPGAR